MSHEATFDGGSRQRWSSSKVETGSATTWNDVGTGPGGKQIQPEDREGNPIELFEPAR